MTSEIFQYSSYYFVDNVCLSDQVEVNKMWMKLHLLNGESCTLNMKHTSLKALLSFNNSTILRDNSFEQN